MTTPAESIEVREPAHRSEAAARLTHSPPSRRERAPGRSAATHEQKAAAASGVEIKLPDYPLRHVNIECNAPLSSINARVEKVQSVYGASPFSLPRPIPAARPRAPAAGPMHSAFATARHSQRRQTLSGRPVQGLLGG